MKIKSILLLAALTISSLAYAGPVGGRQTYSYTLEAQDSVTYYTVLKGHEPTAISAFSTKGADAFNCILSKDGKVIASSAVDSTTLDCKLFIDPEKTEEYTFTVKNISNIPTTVNITMQ